MISAEGCKVVCSVKGCAELCSLCRGIFKELCRVVKGVKCGVVLV